MITISTYNILTLPDVSAYFETDYLSGRAKRPVAVGDKVLFLLLKAEKEGEHVGVDNVRARAELYCKEAVFQCVSRPGKGTKTTIVFPDREQGETG